MRAARIRTNIYLDCLLDERTTPIRRPDEAELSQSKVIKAIRSEVSKTISIIDERLN